MPKVNALRTSRKQQITTSTNLGVLSNAGLVAVATVLVYIIHAIKDLSVAAYFGTGAEIEAFMIAYLLPSFVINTIAGSLPSALIPVFARVKETKGQNSGLRLLSATFLCTGVLLILLTCILALIRPFPIPLLASGFSTEKLILTESIYMELLPLILVQGLCSVIGAILNAFDRFAAAALLPSLPSVVILFALVFMGEAATINYLVWTSVIGAVLQLLLLMIASIRMNIWVFPTKHPALIEVGRQYWPLVAGVGLCSANTVIDQAMAASLAAGKVAALGYGDRVVSVILSVAGTALGTVVLPHFSKQIALGNWLEIRKTLQLYSGLILIASIPLLLMFIFCSESIVQLLWQRGAFTASDTQTVSGIQTCYSLRIPFYVLGILLARMLSGMGANRILFWIAILNFILNIVFNLLFMQWWDVYGLALSTSAVYAISCTFLVAAIVLYWPDRIAVPAAMREE